MKKIYTTFLFLIVTSALMAQTNDTLTLHFTGTPTVYGSSNGGLVSGHNGYLDEGKMQLFDINYGVTGTGVITGILFWMAWVEGNPNSVITATIWQDNAGEPGTVLGTVPVTFGSIDTNAAALLPIAAGSGLGMYNAVAVFPTAITIPGDGKFWAGFTMTYAAGDTVGVETTTDGDFTDAVTHTFEEWSDDTYHSFNDGTSATWGLDLALGIFPTVTFGVGINEATPSNESVALNQNFPNPFNTQTSIAYSIKKAGNVSMDIVDITGRKVFNKDLGYKTSGNHNFILSAGSLKSGIYFYTLTTNGVTATRRMSVTR